MQRVIRSVLVIGGILTLGLAVGYAWQMPWAINTWLWEDSRFSYIFVASMQAAIAAAMIWIGLSGELGIAAAGALNLVVMMGGMAVYLGQVARQPAREYLIYYAIGCGLFALFNVLLFFWSRRIPIRDPRPTPWPVRLSYGLFTAVLVVVGGALILQTPNIFPWPLKPESSVVFGWMFLGDAFYFLYALLYARWHAARAQLWSFLAYDLVLLGPFLLHFQTVKPELRNGLIVYTGVLVYSGLLAVYYLLLNRATRAGSGQPVRASENVYELRTTN